MSTIPALTLSKIRPRNIPIDFNKYLTLLEKILQQLQEQTGTTSFEVDTDTDVYGVVSPFSKAIFDSVEMETHEFAAGDTAYQTSDSVFISCLNTNSGIITLNPSPEDGEDVIIWRAGAGLVTVSGSINGGSQVVISSIYDAPHFKYSSAAGEWAIV